MVGILFIIYLTRTRCYGLFEKQKCLVYFIIIIIYIEHRLVVIEISFQRKIIENKLWNFADLYTELFF